MPETLATNPDLPLILALAGYAVFANLLTYTAFAVDKHRAVQGGWRMPERTLLLLAALGGWPAAKLAQHRLRHKTRKQPFRLMLNLVGLFLPLVVLVAMAAQTNRISFNVNNLFITSATAPEKPALPRRFGPGS